MDDETSQMMIDRCEASSAGQEYMKNPPPAEWDGVEHLKSKSFQVNQRQKSAAKLANLAGDPWALQLKTELLCK
eukprot:Skav207307  [mRNA]  locus=scaffold533:228647:230187:+ [translate_table: standard]